MTTSVLDATVPGLTLFRRGKVRDTYLLGDDLLMVASNRISAFDVVLPTPIPGKGVVLTQLSRFWFGLTDAIVPNHLISAPPVGMPSDLDRYGSDLAGRTMLVRRAERIDVECVVRGYLSGSAWAEYRTSATVADEPMPEGLRQADRLPRPVFTPAIKNDAGHDQNISIARLRDLVGVDLTRQLEQTSLAIYEFAAQSALARGIILADTKFEFGWIDGELHLIDELLTPDSSRFWDAATYEPGREQASFDKQFVRDWLNESGWNKEPPGPELPSRVVQGTVERYLEAYERLTGTSLLAES